MTDRQNTPDPSTPEKGPGCPPAGLAAPAGPSPASTSGSHAGAPVDAAALELAEHPLRYGWFCPAVPGCSASGGGSYATEEAASDAQDRHLAEIHGQTPPAAPVPAAQRPEVAGEPESGQDGTAGHEGLREQIDAAIRPTMLFGLEGAELDGPGGRQRIGEWVDWIAETVADLVQPEPGRLRDQLEAVEALEEPTP